MLRIKYGTHTHDDGECSIALDRQTLFDETNAPYAERRIFISGVLVGSSSSDISTAIGELNTAYSVHNKNLLLLDDSNNEMENSLYVDDTRNGIRVTRPPSFSTGPGGVYCTYQPYEIQLEAEVSVSSGSNIRSFQEIIEENGGGERYVTIESNVGPPIRQRAREQTVYRYTQSGTAVGITSRPPIPPPLWPQWLVDRGQFRKASPRRMGFGTGQAWENYEVSWSYQFESPRPLRGEPRTLGRTYLY